MDDDEEEMRALRAKSTYKRPYGDIEQQQQHQEQAREREHAKRGGVDDVDRRPSSFDAASPPAAAASGFDVPMSFGQKNTGSSDSLKYAQHVKEFGEYDDGGDDDDDDDDENSGDAGPAAKKRKKKKKKKRRAGDAANDSDLDQEGDEDGPEGDRPTRRLCTSLKKLPVIRNVAKLRGHENVVSALGLDRPGSRMLTGGFDYTVRLWDFNGMDRRLRPFRAVEPFPGYQILSLSYSPTASQFLVVSTKPQAKLFSREGLELAEFRVGDRYLFDQKQTKGHTGPLRAGSWHPADKQAVLTCSQDATARVWDVDQAPSKGQRLLVVCKDSRGQKTPCTASAWIGDGGDRFAVGCEDGVVRVWTETQGFAARPLVSLGGDRASAKWAHWPGENAVTCICSGSSSLHKKGRDHFLLTRGGADGQGSLRLWDLRKPSAPLFAYSDRLDSRAPNTECGFSPDGKYFFTGTCAAQPPPAGSSAVEDPWTAYGQLVLFKTKDLDELSEPVARLDVCRGGAVVRAQWHDKMNQIVLGCSDGAVRVLYDERKEVDGGTSRLGVLPALKRSGRKIQKDYVPEQQAFYVDERERVIREPTLHQQRVTARQDRVATKRPDIPQEDIDAARKKVEAAVKKPGSTASQLLLKEMDTKPTDFRAIDPREALLKYADAADGQESFVSQAYALTQPKPIFDTTPEIDEKDRIVPFRSRSKQAKEQEIKRQKKKMEDRDKERRAKAR